MNALVECWNRQSQTLMIPVAFLSVLLLNQFQLLHRCERGSNERAWWLWRASRGCILPQKGNDSISLFGTKVVSEGILVVSMSKMLNKWHSRNGRRKLSLFATTHELFLAAYLGELRFWESSFRYGWAYHVVKGLWTSFAQLIIDRSLMTLEKCHTLVHASDWSLWMVNFHWFRQFRASDRQLTKITLTNGIHLGLI